MDSGLGQIFSFIYIYIYIYIYKKKNVKEKSTSPYLYDKEQMGLENERVKQDRVLQKEREELKDEETKRRKRENYLQSRCTWILDQFKKKRYK